MSWRLLQNYNLMGTDNVEDLLAMMEGSSCVTGRHASVYLKRVDSRWH
jgi:hypothetical protein